MDVVATGVHHGHDLARIVLGDDGARIGQTGLLLDRQRIHVRAHQHGRSLSIAKDTDDAVAADVLGDLETESAQASGKLRGSLLLVPGKLRVAMQVQIQRVERRIGGVETGKFGRSRGRVGRKDGNQGEQARKSEPARNEARHEAPPRPALRAPVEGDRAGPPGQRIRRLRRIRRRAFPGACVDPITSSKRRNSHRRPRLVHCGGREACALAFIQ